MQGLGKGLQQAIGHLPRSALAKVKIQNPAGRLWRFPGRKCRNTGEVYPQPQEILKSRFFHVFPLYGYLGMGSSHGEGHNLSWDEGYSYFKLKG